MSATIASGTYFKKVSIPFIAFGITDETFAVASMKEEVLSESYMLALNFTAYIGWVAGTVAGYLAGDFLSLNIQSSISICLYAMFVAILIPAIKKSFTAGAVAVIAGGVNSLLGYTGLLGSGWNIIISIIAASLTGMFLFKEV